MALRRNGSCHRSCVANRTDARRPTWLNLAYRQGNRRKAASAAFPLHDLGGTPIERQQWARRRRLLFEAGCRSQRMADQAEAARLLVIVISAAECLETVSYRSQGRQALPANRQRISLCCLLSVVESWPEANPLQFSARILTPIAT